jgi:hypothetical protein
MTAHDGLDSLDAAAGPDAAFGLDAAFGPDAEAGPDALRELVREVLREVLPAVAGQPNPLNATSNGSGPVQRHIERVAGSSPAAATRPLAGGTVRTVRLTSDDDLHAFVVEVLRLAGDPRRRQEMLAGRLRFTLARSAGVGPAGLGTGTGSYRAGAVTARQPASPGSPAQTPPAAARKVDKGAVTERAVLAAAKAGERLVLGPRAVLTPLARDKARALGVPVEKER